MKTMERIEGQHQDQTTRAKQVLSWIICAKRPLTTSEVQHALGVETAETDLDKENLPDIEHMVSVCAGLVTVDEGSNIIRLIHHTTQEYFERTQGQWFPDAQLDITATCTAYLSFQAFGNGYAHTDKELEQRFETHVLFDYAAHNWAYHARLAPRCENVLRFLHKKGQVKASSQALLTAPFYKNYSQEFPRNMTGLHLAAYFGLHETVADIEQDNMDVKDSDGQTPLLWAAKNGHKAVVKLLLAAEGVDVNVADGEYGRTPLAWTTVRGDENVVKLLLATKGVDVNAKDTFDNSTPLLLAAQYGREVIDKLLLATADVDIDARNNYNQTPLSLAAERRHDAVVNLLLAVNDRYVGLRRVSPDFDLE